MKHDDVNLSIVKNRDIDLPESLVTKYISKRFEFAFSGLTIKDKKGYLDHLKKELGNINISTFDFGFGKGQCFIEKKENAERINESLSDCLIFISLFAVESYIEIYTNSIKEAEYLFNISKEFTDKDEEPKVRMHDYYLEGRLSFKERVMTSKNLGKISKDYYPDFIDTDGFFKEFTQAKENILVLSGKAGTGKTKFSNLYLNYLMEHLEVLEKENKFDEFGDFEEESNYVNIAYVKNEDILSLDSFWVNLREFEYDIVILDDLDYFLSPRSQTLSNEKELLKDKFISNFLSFTDGLIPNRTKFFISTNRDIEAVDEALKRDGRMFGVFEFSLLNKGEALNIWEKEGLSKEDFNIEFEKDKEILQATLGSKISHYLKNDKKKGKSYLKADSKANISDKFLNKKRVGF